jgi:hypothetical protein
MDALVMRASILAQSRAMQSSGPSESAENPPAALPEPVQPAQEFGGPQGPEPTRFGDWEKNGRCIDF